MAEQNLSEESKPENIPARFRKTKSGKWAVMAPVEALEKALADGVKVDVQKKSGDWSTFKVFSLGKPFDVDGTMMCYGYGPDEEGDNAPASSSGERSETRGPSNRASVGAPPPSDPTEPLPEYQGGADDEWVEF